MFLEPNVNKSKIGWIEVVCGSKVIVRLLYASGAVWSVEAAVAEVASPSCPRAIAASASGSAVRTTTLRSEKSGRTLSPWRSVRIYRDFASGLLL